MIKSGHLLLHYACVIKEKTGENDEVNYQQQNNCCLDVHIHVELMINGSFGTKNENLSKFVTVCMYMYCCLALN